MIYMITILLKTLITATQNSSELITLGLNNDKLYYLKAKITPFKKETKKESECVIKIVNISDYNQEVLHRFFKEDVHNFYLRNFTPRFPNLCVCALGYFFPNSNSTKWLWLELTSVDNNIINNLNTSIEKKEELYSIIDRYLKDDFKSAISEISIFGEYIAKELVKKLKKNPKSFRTALNILVSFNMSKNTKINYNYIGSLLWPIHYIRNQKLHPYHKIKFNKSTMDLCFENLSEIIRYLSSSGIKF